MSQWFERYGYARVGEGLFAGAYPLDAADVRRLAEEGVDLVYNLCQESEYASGERQEVSLALEAEGIEERRLPMIDYAGFRIEVLERAVKGVLSYLRAGRTVYLHCRAGWQRSAAVAAGVIALHEQVPLAQALELLRERKPTSAPLPHQRADLIEWWQGRQG